MTLDEKYEILKELKLEDAFQDGLVDVDKDGSIKFKDPRLKLISDKPVTTQNV